MPKNKKQEFWCYSLNNKDYSSGTFPSSKLALIAGQQEAKELSDESKPISVIYLAKAEHFQNHSFYPDGCDIIEHMAEQADSEAGDHANNYPDVSDEAEDELTAELHALLEKWCEKHNVSPSFYSVSEPIMYDTTTLKKLRKQLKDKKQ